MLRRFHLKSATRKGLVSVAIAVLLSPSALAAEPVRPIVAPAGSLAPGVAPGPKLDAPDKIQPAAVRRKKEVLERAVKKPVGKKVPLQGETKRVAPFGSEPGPLGPRLAPLASPGRALPRNNWAWVRAIQPSSGPPGTLVVVRGNYLATPGTGGQLFFGGVEARPLQWSHDEIRVIVPDRALPGARLRVLARKPEPRDTFDIQFREANHSLGVGFRVTAAVEGRALNVDGGSAPAGVEFFARRLVLSIDGMDRPRLDQPVAVQVSVENQGDAEAVFQIVVHPLSRVVDFGDNHRGARMVLQPNQRRSLGILSPAIEGSDLRCTEADCFVDMGAFLTDASGRHLPNVASARHTEPMRGGHFGVSQITFESFTVHDTCEDDRSDEGEFDFDYILWRGREMPYRRSWSQDMRAGQVSRPEFVTNLHVYDVRRPDVRFNFEVGENDFLENWDRTGVNVRLGRDLLLAGGRIEVASGKSPGPCAEGAVSVVVVVAPFDPWNTAHHSDGR